MTEYLQKVNTSRSFIRFCCQLFKIQAQSGRRALFEHPRGAKTWKYPEMASLLRRYHTVDCDMCQYGLKLPDSDHSIRKNTKLLVTHDDMKVLGKLCPGKSGPQHATHDHVTGSHPVVGKISQYAGQYTEEFVRAVLNTVPAYRQHAAAPEVLMVHEDTIPDHVWPEALAVAQEESQRTDAELQQILLKLHKNLGHPQSHDLIRVLKNAQASDRALQLARNLTCPVCDSQCKPKVPLPAQTQRVSQFNEQTGIDVKHLTGCMASQSEDSCTQHSGHG